MLGLLAEGRDNAAVARRLGVGSKTVRNHVSNIIAKLHVADRSGAIIEPEMPAWARPAAQPDLGASWTTTAGRARVST